MNIFKNTKITRKLRISSLKASILYTYLHVESTLYSRVHDKQTVQ